MKFGWERNSAETKVVRAEAAVKGFRDLAEGSKAQVEKFAQNEKLVAVFIGSGLREKVLGATSENEKVEIAKQIAKENTHLVPDTMDIDEQVGYVIALAEELDKPQYKH